MESVKMILVLTLICSACGLLLAGAQHATEDRIEEQIMRYVKGPAVKKVLGCATNNPVQDRKQVEVGERLMTVFIGRKGDKVEFLAYETAAAGFGGEKGVMVGYEIGSDRLLGIGITSHKETPGVGSRVTQDTFTDRFVGKALAAKFSPKKDGGEIDAVTGATFSSRAACAAVRASVKCYVDVKAKLITTP